MGEPLLKVENLGVRVGAKHLLHNVTLEVCAGEIVTIVGPNGAGKSTLLKAIIGAVPACDGHIHKRDGLRIGYTPQKLHLEKTLPMPVVRFLSLAGRLKKGARAEVLTQTNIADLRQTQMADLSGGELQRVLLARALLRKPDLLILDEPTQGLDQPAEERFYRLLAHVRQDTGAAVLMVSHDLHVVMAESDRVICLNGHVCCSGVPSSVSADPAYHEMFGNRAALAPYQHHHDHSHEYGEAGHD